MNRRLLLAPVLVLVTGMLAVLGATPAQAAGRVTVANEFGSAKIDGRYSTTLTVSGSGFQSVKGGHGGIYVWFGTVNGAWQPSKGGVSGQNYRYVPDSEEADNQGFQRYVAFPGSDTASSAAATMGQNGSWRVTLAVPGPRFKAVGRSGTAVDVDCTKVQCGVLTIGAHGVKNANNETFTPIAVDDLYEAAPGASSEEQPSATVPGVTDPQAAPAGKKPKTGKPKLEVDRASAVAGRVLPFTVSGLAAGQQISVVFADGRAAAGPFLVGDTGQLAGVITLPADLAAGTYELRAFGVASPPAVKFAVRAADDATDAAPAAAESESDDAETWGKLFVGFAAALLLVALARLLLIARSRRAK